MKSLVIDLGTRRLSQCRKCGQVIEWATAVRSEKPIAFNVPLELDDQAPLFRRNWRHVDLTKTSKHQC